MLEQFEKLYSQRSAATLFRKEGWEAFAAAPLPLKNEPAFRYLPFEKLYQKRFTLAPLKSASLSLITPHLFPEANGFCLIFVNGHFCPNLSRLPATLTALPLIKAERSYRPFLQKQGEEGLKLEKSPFVHLNRALSEQGLFLYLAPNTELTAPVELLFFQTEDLSDALLTPRVEICIGKKSSLTLLSKTISSGEGENWVNGVTQVFLEEGAKLSFIEEETKEGFAGWHFSSLRALLKRESTFSFFSFSRGATRTRWRDLNVRLVGENSVAKIKAIELLRGKEEAHNHIVVCHQAPFTRSDQQIKSLASDRARVGFTGKIFVAQKAQKTDAYQLSNNLILSEQAVAYSQPNLEVFADDVKASHGATCSRLDDEQLFYLCARGLSRADGEKLLVRAFCRELIGSLASEKQRKRCYQAVDDLRETP